MLKFQDKFEGVPMLRVFMVSLVIPFMFTGKISINKMSGILFYFSLIVGRRFIQIVSFGENLNEVLSPIFWKKYFKMLSANANS